jgi:hypothetical protein
MANVIATCSSIGETVLTDLRCKDTVMRYGKNLPCLLSEKEREMRITWIFPYAVILKGTQYFQTVNGLPSIQTLS